eukprot:SAG31_NODE_20658_length_568_cov_1.245203_1_plen_53_part_00
MPKAGQANVAQTQRVRAAATMGESACQLGSANAGVAGLAHIVGQCKDRSEWR